MPITVSAPGKIHLLGEHTVVYGRPALLAAINKRLFVTLRAGGDYFFPKNGLMAKAVEVFQKAFSLSQLPPFTLTLSSEIPSGVGLGSSAALAAAVIGVLMRFFKKTWDLEKINCLAFEVEKKAHGRPSGGDNAVVVFGGLLWFRRELSFLSDIIPLSFPNYQLPSLFLVDSGKPQETTREMVKKVARFSSQKKYLFRKILQEQEELTKRLLVSLKEGQKKIFQEVIKKGEENLEKIGVVGRFAQKIIREIESLGGAAKVCGAGGVKEGSGMILAFHPEPQKIQALGKKYAWPIFPLKVVREGVRIEKT